ncbi:MAG: flavin reductase, partial [Bdellovibrionales bacterium]|nr:flavin reductase [Bdellovibrionales bacterium]
PRHTLMNMTENPFFTVNHIHPEIYKKAHQTSARYDRGQSEFEMTGLETEFKDDFNAPYVAASHLQIGMSLKDIMDVKLNNTQIVVGQIERIYLPEDSIKKDGFVDLEKIESLCVSSLDSYHSTKRLSRLNYAKPDKETYEIDLEGDL